jgi:UDPglucose 6-dehydrogenase
MRVAVVGCGYVGLVTGVGLASVGHQVLAIEADPGRLEQVAAGSPPFHEPGLQGLLRSELRSGRFGVSSDLREAADEDVVLLAVQTPPDPTGGIDLRYLERAAASLAEAFADSPRRRRAVVIRSTVVPGTAEAVVAPSFEADVAVASNPEFLREGSALEDFLHPDRVVVGCEEEWGRELLAELYRPFDAPLIFTSPATAELAKYTSNAFLATLVSFSNEIARICESVPGVDVEDVLGIIHSDRRLTPKVDGRTIRPEILSYLKAGCGFGGSCLPKDISALIAASKGRGEELPLLEAVRAVNEAQPVRVVESAARALGGLEGRTVAVLGLAFKGGTDDLRSSPGLRIVEELLARGARVTVYDPLVSARALAEHQRSGQLSTAHDAAAALEAAEACIITTNAPEFRGLGDLLAEGDYSDTVIIDGRRVIDHARVGHAAYLAVGRAGERSSPPVPR